MSTQTTKSPKSSKKKNKKKGWRTAEGADIHELYELSVQDAEAEVDLIDQVWQERRGRVCNSLREDFCGTALVCREWVKRRKKNHAVGVDIDESVLEWAEARMKKQMSPDQIERIKLIADDVITVDTEKVECITASNFSYFLFKSRADLLRYFKRARATLDDDGLFLLDAYGGRETFEEMEEERDMDGFTYVWDQDYYNPINGTAINYIHFRFPDGTKIDRAFTYEWRVWTLPEIQEVLQDAGFSRITVYWEGTDEDGEGDGNWEPATEGEACEGWVAYLVAEK
mgnify:CR=1 FL=1